jgi:hypothetical protein
MPLLEKYDLHILEMCKSVQELSKELARTWLSTFMLDGEADKPSVEEIVEFFSNYDIQKSHGRSIDRQKARELGLAVRFVEEVEGMNDLLRSLYNQYELWFDKTPFYKLFEDARGTSWAGSLRR